MGVLTETTLAALHSLRDVALDWGRPSSKKTSPEQHNSGSSDVSTSFFEDHSAAISRSMVFEPFSTTTL